jgi:hypothetical protein
MRNAVASDALLVPEANEVASGSVESTVVTTICHQTQC